MQLSICWPRRACTRAAADSRIRKLLAVLRAARRHPAYSNASWLREAEEAARAEEPPERVLNLIPTNPPCPAKPRIRTIRSRVLVQVPPGVSVLGEAGRERLWAASGLPVFEQLCGLGGEVLASECDAHEGYHLDTNAAVFELLDGGLVLTSLEGLRYPTLRVRTGWPGIIQRNACPCGSPSPRFLSASSASLR